MDRGWVKLFRKTDQWEWYTNIPAKVLFIHLLIRANNKPVKWRGIDIPVGGLVTSRAKLAVETGLSEKQVRSAIEHLVSTGEVASKTTSKYTLLIVKNYSEYQVQGQQRASKGPSKRPGEGQQRATNKNKENKRREEEEKNSVPDLSFLASSVDRVIAYLNETAGKNFRFDSEPESRIIADRIEEGYTVADMKKVIDLKCREWKGDPKMDRFIRPLTLFKREKFPEYLAQCQDEPDKSDKEAMAKRYGGTWV